VRQEAGGGKHRIAKCRRRPLPEPGLGVITRRDRLGRGISDGPEAGDDATRAMFVLASAFLFAAHIIALSKWSLGRDVYAMTVIQLTMCAILSGVASIPGGYSAPPDSGVWAVVVFTAVFATAIAFIVQTWSQAHMSATKVAVILTMEVVFAALFAILFGGEILTLQSAIGGVLVVTAMYLIVLKEQK